MSVEKMKSEVIQPEKKEIIQPQKMGLLVENPVYKLDFLLVIPFFVVE